MSEYAIGVGQFVNGDGFVIKGGVSPIHDAVAIHAINGERVTMTPMPCAAKRRVVRVEFDAVEFLEFVNHFNECKTVVRDALTGDLYIIDSQHVVGL